MTGIEAFIVFVFLMLAVFLIVGAAPSSPPSAKTKQEIEQITSSAIDEIDRVSDNFLASLESEVAFTEKTDP